MMRRLGAVLCAILVFSTALAAAGAGGAVPVTRHATISLAPASGDLELLELEYGRHRRRAVSHATLRLTAQGLTGGDYLAAATPRRRPHGELIALVLLVDRPGTAQASVRLSVRSARALGPLFVLGLRNPFTSTRSSIVGVNILSDLPCKVPTAAAGMSGADLRPLSGGALGGFTAAGAVAAAYDVVCHRAYPLAFRQAVRGARGEGCGASASQDGSLCCPPAALCAPPNEPVPAPAPEPGPAPPPRPEPPRCPPCDPQPGHACPLAASPAYCVAGRSEVSPYAPLLAH